MHRMCEGEGVSHLEPAPALIWGLTVHPPPARTCGGGAAVPVYKGPRASQTSPCDRWFIAPVGCMEYPFIVAAGYTGYSLQCRSLSCRSLPYLLYSPALLFCCNCNLQNCLTIPCLWESIWRILKWVQSTHGLFLFTLRESMLLGIKWGATRNILLLS